MRGRDHVRTRRLTTAVLGAVSLAVSLPGTGAMAVGEPGELPACSEPGSDGPGGGQISRPWEVVLDEDGEVTGYRLTLRLGPDEHVLRTGRRGFAVRAGAQRLLIGERSQDGTALDMIDVTRACRLWSQRVDRLLYPEHEEADGGLRLGTLDRESRRYEGVRVVDPENGSTEAVMEGPCLEICYPSDGAISLAALEGPTTVRPTPEFSAGGWSKDKELTFRWASGSEPPTWARSPLKGGADDATGSSGSRSPVFVQASGGANAVAYGKLAGFCGTSAIACAGRSMPTYWGVWIRPHGTDYSWGTLRWCQKTSSSSGCFDIRRVMIHELGHVTGLNHPSADGFRLAAADSLMQAVTPMRPQDGASRHAFGRCDVATLQELYDTPDNKTGISTCNDVATKVWLTASKWTISEGASVTLTATLRIANQSAYRELAANPLNGRALKLKYRKAGSNHDWTTVWMRSTYKQGRYEVTLTPSSSWEFKAVFGKPADEGLRYSRSDVKKVKVSS